MIRKEFYFVLKGLLLHFQFSSHANAHCSKSDFLFKFGLFHLPSVISLTKRPKSEEEKEQRFWAAKLAFIHLATKEQEIFFTSVVTSTPHGH